MRRHRENLGRFRGRVRGDATRARRRWVRVSRAVFSDGDDGKGGGTKEIETAQPKNGARERVVTIGDLHGDLEQTKRAFRACHLTNSKDRWIGGKTTVVQVGDQLDRGRTKSP